MPKFEVQVNGKGICIAGLTGQGVLGAHVSSVHRQGPRKPPTLSLHVGGMDSISGEHLVWHEALRLNTGDEVRIKIVEDGPTDKPAMRKKPDASRDLRARKNYVRRMAKELGWKLVTPK